MTTPKKPTDDTGANGPRFSASRHESVWFNTKIRTDPIIKAITDGAHWYWLRLPFLADDDGWLPSLAVIAADADRSEAETEEILVTLVKHGLIERDGERLRMSAYSQTLYCYSEEEADARDAAAETEDAQEAEDTTEDEA